MNGNNILLDSNVVIELFKGNAWVLKKLQNVRTVNISSIVLGELLLGAYRSSNAEKHLLQINSFLEVCTVFPVTSEAADEYAQIKSSLLKRGKPIPENDIWIAAVASLHNLTLVTSDKHFNEIEGLKIEKW